MASAASALFSIVPAASPTAAGTALASKKGVDNLSSLAEADNAQGGSTFSALLQSSSQPDLPTSSSTPMSAMTPTQSAALSGDATAAGLLDSTLSQTGQPGMAGPHTVPMEATPVGAALMQAEVQPLMPVMGQELDASLETAIPVEALAQADGQLAKSSLSTPLGIEPIEQDLANSDQAENSSFATLWAGQDSAAKAAEHSPHPRKGGGFPLASLPVVKPEQTQDEANGIPAEAADTDASIEGDPTTASDSALASAIAALTMPLSTSEPRVRGSLGRMEADGARGDQFSGFKFDGISQTQMTTDISSQDMLSGSESAACVEAGPIRARAPAFASILEGSQIADGQSSAMARDSGFTSPLLTQAMEMPAARPAALPYAVNAPAQGQSASVSVQEGQFGTDMGVEIARAVDQGSDDLLIRLDPRSLGRIDVRLSFDHDGVLRAVMSAENAAALDLLRREGGDLTRALADAGVRADHQSLRFDSRFGGQNSQGFLSQGQHHNGQSSGGSGQQDRAAYWASGRGSDVSGIVDEPVYRPLASSGHVDLMA